MKVTDIKVRVFDHELNAIYGKIVTDKTLRLQLQNILAQMCDPYVPFLEGALAGSGIANITEDGVTYNTPYARYQYYLHDMSADLAGVTNRTREYHPLATSYWDRAMVLQKSDELAKRVEEAVKRRYGLK